MGLEDIYITQGGPWRGEGRHALIVCMHSFDCAPGTHLRTHMRTRLHPTTPHTYILLPYFLSGCFREPRGQRCLQSGSSGCCQPIRTAAEDSTARYSMLVVVLAQQHPTPPPRPQPPHSSKQLPSSSSNMTAAAALCRHRSNNHQCTAASVLGCCQQRAAQNRQQRWQQQPQQRPNRQQQLCRCRTTPMLLRLVTLLVDPWGCCS